ncbi:MAG TPA: hypothetical protein VF792_02700 [Ktedonobacterales bacterium]
MFGRVTKFNVASEKTDAAIDYGNNTVRPAVLALGGLGLTMLTDRKSGLGYAIAWWKDEAAATGSASEANKIRDAFKQAMNATVLDIHTYDVAVDVDLHKASTLAARVTPGEADPARSDEFLTFVKTSIVPKVQAQSGFCRWCSLIDRQTGKNLSITFWESIAARDADPAILNQNRDAATQTFGAKLDATEYYEVSDLGLPMTAPIQTSQQPGANP